MVSKKIDRIFVRVLSSSYSLGTDIKLDEEKMKMGWRIENKLKNAKKFIDIQISNYWIGEDETLLEEYQGWKDKILNSFEEYEIDKASSLMYHFLWNTFCDKWIEDSKKKSTSLTLKYIIDDFEDIFKIIYNELKE